MPLPIVLNAKIIIQKHTKPIITAYRESIHECMPEYENDPYISVESNSTEGFFNKINFFNLEFLKSEKFSLRSFSVLLDKPAVIVRKDYIKWMQVLLEWVRKKSGQTEINVIDSRFVLVVELLIRLVTLAVSADMKYAKEGERIVKLIRSFIEKVSVKGLLDEQSIGMTLLLRNVEYFNGDFFRDHAEKLNQIHRVIRLIQILRTPENAFTKMIDYLSDSRIFIMRQIIMMLKPNTKETELTENRIDSTFSGLHKSSMSNSILLERYGLLKETNLLYEIISREDFTQIAKGWDYLSNHELDPSKLKHLIKKHYQFFSGLKFQKSEILHLNRSAGVVLRHLKADTPEYLAAKYEDSIEALNILESRDVKIFIETYIDNNVKETRKLMSDIPNRYWNDFSRKLSDTSPSGGMIGQDETMDDVMIGYQQTIAVLTKQIEQMDVQASEDSPVIPSSKITPVEQSVINNVGVESEEEEIVVIVESSVFWDSINTPSAPTAFSALDHVTPIATTAPVRYSNGSNLNKYDSAFFACLAASKNNVDNLKLATKRALNSCEKIPPRAEILARAGFTGFQVTILGLITPLAMAAASGSLEAVEYLINEVNVNPFVLCGPAQTWTALDLAKFYNKNNVVKLLEGYENMYYQYVTNNNLTPPNPEDACKAAYRNHLPWIKALHAQGCDFNKTSTGGYVGVGDNILQTLIPIPLRSPMTPLQIAQSKKHTDIVNYLTPLTSHAQPAVEHKSSCFL